MKRIPFFLTVLVHCLLSQTASGKAEEKKVVLKIPAKYRGYNLRISGREYKLNNEQVKVLATTGRHRLELSDRNNRLMADNFSRVGPKTVDRTRERPLQAGAELGFGFEAGSKLDKLRVSGSSYGGGVHAVYRPSSFGLMLNYNYHRMERATYDDGPKGSLESNRVGLAGVYEWVPLDRGPLFFERMHIAFMAGAVWGRVRAEISEDDVSVTDSAQTLGGMGAIELRIPLAVNLWLALRETYETYQLELDKLNFDEDIHELNSTVGVRYAF